MPPGNVTETNGANHYYITTSTGNVIETNGANHYYITTSTGSLPINGKRYWYDTDTVPEIRIEDVVGRTYIIRDGRIEVQESPDDRELTAASEEDIQEFLFGEKE